MLKLLEEYFGGLGFGSANIEAIIEVLSVLVAHNDRLPQILSHLLAWNYQLECIGMPKDNPIEVGKQFLLPDQLTVHENLSLTFRDNVDEVFLMDDCAVTLTDTEGIHLDIVFLVVFCAYRGRALF